MKFFIDTADLKQIKLANSMGILDGVTTNPSLMSTVGVKGKEEIMNHYLEICKIVDGPVSAEVLSTDYDSMILEGQELNDLHDEYNQLVEERNRHFNNINAAPLDQYQKNNDYNVEMKQDLLATHSFKTPQPMK